MAYGVVRFRLAGGGTMEVSDEALQAVYDELWNLAHEPGAVSTAALLMYEWRQAQSSRQAVQLTRPQSDALRRAAARRDPTAGANQNRLAGS